MKPASCRRAKVDRQAVERVHADVRAEVGHRPHDQIDPLLDAEERRLLRIVEHADHEPVEQARCASRHVEMGVRHRVERAGKDRHPRHRPAASRKLSIVSPNLRWRTGSRPATSGDLGSPEVLDHHHRVGSQVRLEGAKRRHDSTHLVRRIEEGEVPRPAAGRGKEPFDVASARPWRVGQVRPLQVGAQRGERRTRLLHERRVGGAPRQCLDADRAAAGVEVEHPRIQERARRGCANSVSLTRSVIGRVPRSRGATSGWPPATPAMTRIRPRRRLRWPVRSRSGAAPAAAGVPATDPSPTTESASPRARCASSMCRGSNRDATRSGGSPDWRVPSRLPAPRSARSASAIAKPSFEPRTTSSRRMARSSVASESRMQKERCVPRPTRPRSWCSWARPNRSASSITITLAFGTSMPDLDHGRGDEQVHLAGREGRHRRVAQVGLLLAVHDPDAQLRERRSQSLGLGLGARRLQRVRLGDERHDHEGLATLGRLGGQEGLDLRHCPTVADLRADRLPSGRQMADRADRQVAVDAERQRARDRGGGQRQHVRLAAAPLRLQRRTLSDAEAVLLVDDHQAQPRELDRLADHRVRADHDLRGAGRDRVVDLPLARRGQGPGQELGPHPEARRAAAPGRRGAAAPGSRSAPSAPPASRHERRLPAPRPRPRSCRCRRRPAAGGASAARPAMSSTISATAASWSSVSVKGSAPMISARSASVTAIAARAGRRAPRRAWASVSCRASSSSNASRSSASVTSAASSGKCAVRSASSSAGRPPRSVSR